MTNLELKLAGWTGPSSPTEQEKQDRTERMIREAIEAHPAFDGMSCKIYAKGSYANNTNVKADTTLISRSNAKISSTGMNTLRGLIQQVTVSTKEFGRPKSSVTN
ncbi:hypothetical protein ACL1A8_12465 [Corynebacterium striatum]